jgi:phosphate transport system substrate-binding protein
MTGQPTPEREDSETLFETQAQAAGIVLPKKSRGDPWGALVVVVALIVLTAGIGEITGWVNLRSPTPAGGGSFETQTCTGTSILAVGGVSSAFDPAYLSWLGNASEQLSQAVGGCFALKVNSTTGDGYASLLGKSPAEFAATYSTPSSEESQSLTSPVQVLPVALSAVALIYNLPGVPTGLNLTGSILAGIYNGSITSWSDPAILAVNPGLDLGGLPAVAPVQRTDASLSNDVFSQFLAAASPTWGSTVGSGISVPWPAGRGVDSDTAMVSAVASAPGSIGYLELFGLPTVGLGVAQIQDIAGDFAAPNVVDAWVAADSFANSTAVLTGNWSAFSLMDASAHFSYPLTVLSYAGIYRDLGVAYAGGLSLTDATWLLTFLYWLTGEESISPLPVPYANAALNVLNNETYDGTSIIHLESENGEGNETGGETGEF